MADTHPKSASNGAGSEGARTIFFMGKPGSGKGTQTKILSEKTGWTVFTSGELFRSIAKQETPVGRKVREENDAGLLQPHWFAMYLYLQCLFSLPEGGNAIFDGFNRKTQEASLIIDSMLWLKRPFSVILINISDGLVRSRINARAATSGRADDLVIEERLKEYRDYTLPAIELFRDAGVLLEVDGEQPPEKISADVQALLKIS